MGPGLFCNSQVDTRECLGPGKGWRARQGSLIPHEMPVMSQFLLFGLIPSPQCVFIATQGRLAFGEGALKEVTKLSR